LSLDAADTFSPSLPASAEGVSKILPDNAAHYASSAFFAIISAARS